MHDETHPLGDNAEKWRDEILGLPNDEPPEQLAYEASQSLAVNQNKDVMPEINQK